MGFYLQDIWNDMGLVQCRPRGRPISSFDRVSL